MNESESEEETELVSTPLVFLYIHGFAERNPLRAGVGIVSVNQDGTLMFSIRNWLGERTINQTEYWGLLFGLGLLLRWWDVDRLVVRTNCKLLAKQMVGDWQVRNIELRRLKDEVDGLIEQVEDFEIELIPREENEEAIRLSEEGVSVIGAECGYEEPDANRIRIRR